MQPPPPLGNSISGKKVRYFRDERTVSYSYSSIPCSSSSRRRRSMNDVTIATAAKRRELDSHAAVAMAARHNSVLFFETRSGGGNGTTGRPRHRGSGCIGLFLSREVGRGTLTKANPCCGTPSIFNKMFCACCVYICRTLLSPDQQTHAEEKRDREKRGNSESFGRFLSARIS